MRGRDFERGAWRSRCSDVGRGELSGHLLVREPVSATLAPQLRTYIGRHE